jgi:hypothetical protein
MGACLSSFSGGRVAKSRKHTNGWLDASLTQKPSPARLALRRDSTAPGSRSVKHAGRLEWRLIGWPIRYGGGRPGSADRRHRSPTGPESRQTDQLSGNGSRPLAAQSANEPGVVGNPTRRRGLRTLVAVRDRALRDLSLVRAFLMPTCLRGPALTIEFAEPPDRSGYPGRAYMSAEPLNCSSAGAGTPRGRVR